MAGGEASTPAAQSSGGSGHGVAEPADRRASELGDFWLALVACRHDLPVLLRVIAERVVDLLGDGCVLTTLDADGTTLHPMAVVHADPAVSAAMQAVLGRTDAYVGEGVAGTVAADRRPIVLNDLPPDADTGPTPERFRAFVRDHPMRALMIVPLVAAGELVGTLGSVRTSTDEPFSLADLRLLEALADRAALAISESTRGPRAVGPADFEAIYRHNLDGVLITTPDGHILAANPAACEILDRSEREIIDGGRDGVVVVGDPRLARALARRAVAGHARAELPMRRGEGTIFVADVSSTIFSTADHQVRAVVIFRDVSEEVASRARATARIAELEQVADRDPLTGLWNRRGFSVAAEQALASADRQGTVSQLVFVDLDRLKEINDKGGHATGDSAIIAVASAIRRAIRDVDVAGRVGGDEFVVLLVEAGGDDVSLVVERIREELDDAAGAPCPVTVSIGVVERPPHLEATLAELIDAADRDMYQQKVLGRLGPDT